MNLEPLTLVVLLGCLQLIFGGYVFLSLIDMKLDIPRQRRGYILTLVITYFPLTIISFYIFQLIKKIEFMTLNLLIDQSMNGIIDSLLLCVILLSFLHFVISCRYGNKFFFSSLRFRKLVAIMIAAIALAVIIFLFIRFDLGFIGIALITVQSILSGLLLGGSLTSMTWGHWYLVTPSLPKEPLELLTKNLLIIIFLSLIYFIFIIYFNYLIIEIDYKNYEFSLISNPALWLRFFVGLCMPLILTIFAYKAARINGMMSATGLLYLVLGSTLAGVFLSNALLFEIGLSL